jgi:hypothetical protein
MGQYREIRVRLNLRRHRDRWLSSELDRVAEALEIPVASVVRRALAAFVRGGSPAPQPQVGQGGARPQGAGEGAPGGARGGTAPRHAEPRREAGDRHPSGEEDILGRLAALGVPPGAEEGE